MTRVSVALGILGLVGAAAMPASAQKTIKIFGTTYSVSARSLAQTYANGVKTVAPNSNDQRTALYYSEGASPAEDRLWAVVRIGGGLIGDNGDIEPAGDAFLYMEGIDQNGQFAPAVSKAKSFFGGSASDRWHNRRPVNVIELNRIDTGKKKDRNVLATTFMNDDGFRMWDIDTMDGFGGGHEGTGETPETHDDDALFQRVRPGQAPGALDEGSAEADPGLPSGSYPGFAHLPTADGHTILVAGGPHGDTTSTGLAIWDTATADPAKDTAIDLTETGVVTKDAAKPWPAAAEDGTAYLNTNLIKYSGSGNVGEYWFMLVSADPGGGTHDTPEASIRLVRANVEVPSDLKANNANSIKVTVLDSQDITADQNGVLSVADTSGVQSFTVGREVPGTNGKRMLYASDFDYNLYTLTPQP